MSDVATVSDKSNPRTVYLKDYRAPDYVIDEIQLDFELNDDETRVKSRLVIRRIQAKVSKNRELRLDGDELLLDSILLDGAKLDENSYQLTDKHLILLNVPEKFTLEIVTKIYPQKNTALSGLYRSGDTYCTQCEAEGFRRITYFLDQPDILTRYSTTIHADKKKFPSLLSNGNLVASGDEANGRHWARWEDPFKKPSYLFALVAGDFDIVTDEYTTGSGRVIDLKIYVEKGYADQATHTLYSLKEAMHWDEKTYGREYDLDVYMIVAIGDFNMGAMENKGLNIFNTKYALAKPETATDDDYIHILSVVGHEYFHNWTGNRVTCRDWFQLSLKEGLTIFRDQTFTEDTLSHAVMRIREVMQLRESQFIEDASPLAHPVRPDSYIEINNFYTATVYNKGAEVLRMLRTLLGTSLFREGMDLYFNRHDGQAVTIEDFVKAMEEVSGMDLTQFRRWYDQAGTPTVIMSDDYDGGNNVYTLTVTQTIPPTPNQTEKKPLLIPIRMGLLDEEGHEIQLYLDGDKGVRDKVLTLTEASQTFRFKNVISRPVPSLMRDFSAPVILKFPYADADYGLLFKHDSDDFNRWEAGQKYMLNLSLNLVRDYQQEKSMVLPRELSEIFAYILDHKSEDKFLLSEMLMIPSEKYIGEQMEVIDVDAIHAAREFMLSEVAHRLQKLFLDIYQHNHEANTPYKFNMYSVGKRQLKNRCLSYFMLLDKYHELGQAQFHESYQSNMTDAQAALVALSNIEGPVRQKALEKFYDAWQKDALVLDKWFAIQAACKLPNTLQQVKKLVRHPAFDIKNPNKVYALIGTFTHRNAVHFHNKDGEGYAFLRDIVQQLDKLNPQVAARMVKPLTTWKRYDKERQELMRSQLELLAADTKLSKDLYEIVTKTLE